MFNLDTLSGSTPRTSLAENRFSRPPRQALRSNTSLVSKPHAWRNISRDAMAKYRKPAAFQPCPRRAVCHGARRHLKSQLVKANIPQKLIQGAFYTNDESLRDVFESGSSSCSGCSSKHAERMHAICALVAQVDRIRTVRSNHKTHA